MGDLKPEAIGHALGYEGAMTCVGRRLDAQERPDPREWCVIEYLPNSSPFGIAAGPDGNLWFTGAADPGRIGRITPGPGG